MELFNNRIHLVIKHTRGKGHVNDNHLEFVKISVDASLWGSNERQDHGFFDITFYL